MNFVNVKIPNYFSKKKAIFNIHELFNVLLHNYLFSFVKHLA
jgi:Na+/phosphate symporter